MSILALPPFRYERELRPLRYLPGDSPPALDPVPEGMTGAQRVRAHLFLDYLEVALKREFSGQLYAPCERYKTSAAFDAARDHLAIALSLERCNTLLAGQTRDRAATLLYEHLGHAYTAWGLADIRSGQALEAIARVRDSLAVTAL